MTKSHLKHVFSKIKSKKKTRTFGDAMCVSEFNVRRLISLVSYEKFLWRAFTMVLMRFVAISLNIVCVFHFIFYFFFIVRHENNQFSSNKYAKPATTIENQLWHKTIKTDFRVLLSTE